MRALACLAAVAALLSMGCSSTSPAPTPGNYLMGEKVPLGKLSYTVFETQWLTQLGDGPTPRIPQHRFFLIRMNAVNSGSSDLSMPNPVVIDDKGKEYEELSNGQDVPQWAGYLRTIKPADTLEGQIVFDAPAGHYKLKLTDETGARVALVDIPLSFGAETPEIPTPDADKK
jgi:hypothetical protein